MINKPERIKHYKSVDPMVSIQKVREILTRNHIFLIEDHIHHQESDVACCRIRLGDPEFMKLDIGTNGKGITPRFALASAYGEFMERLQNGVLFPLRQMKFATSAYRFMRADDDAIPELSFWYAPDEEYHDIGFLKEKCGEVLASAFGTTEEETIALLQDAYSEQKIGCVPFYDCESGKSILLPEKIIWNMCGTNGMSAGNTPLEALLQGISEIFERYAIRRIYIDRLTPPVIPLELFDDTEVGIRLRKLQAQGMKVEIRDCSLGLSLPVIGLILGKKDGRTAFHLGADSSPITALERCLTELYQGDHASNEQRYFRLETSDRKESVFWLHQMALQIESGFACWPDSVWSTKSSYTFDGFVHPVSISDQEDFYYFMHLIRRNHFHIYIRDVGYLGFPAYQVYIPGMSETDFFYDEGREFVCWMHLVREQTTLLRLPEARPEELSALARALIEVEKAHMAIPLNLKRWFPSNIDHKLQQIDEDKFCALLYGCTGFYAEAVQCMQRYIEKESAQSEPLRFLKALVAYWDLCKEGENKLGNLYHEYGESLMERVLSYRDPHIVFSPEEWPVCFHCEECMAANDCRYCDILKLVQNLQEQYRENLPNQENVKILLEGCYD